MTSGCPHRRLDSSLLAADLLGEAAGFPGCAGRIGWGGPCAAHRRGLTHPPPRAELKGETCLSSAPHGYETVKFSERVPGGGTVGVLAQ